MGPTAGWADRRSMCFLTCSGMFGVNGWTSVSCTPLIDTYIKSSSTRSVSSFILGSCF